MFFIVGSAFNAFGSICFATWDKGMDMAGRKRVIMDRSGKMPYMIRYYLLFRDRGEDTQFNVFIHKIMQSDEDDLHDHPWGYFTFILSGGYWETVGNVELKLDNDEIANFKTTKHWCGRFYMQRVDDTHIHRLELLKDKNTGYEIPCWSLFIPFKRNRDWGFYTIEPNGLKWKSAEEYTREEEPDTSSPLDEDLDEDKESNDSNDSNDNETNKKEN